MSKTSRAKVIEILDDQLGTKEDIGALGNFQLTLLCLTQNNPEIRELTVWELYEIALERYLELL